MISAVSPGGEADTGRAGGFHLKRAPTRRRPQFLQRPTPSRGLPGGRCTLQVALVHHRTDCATEAAPTLSVVPEDEMAAAPQLRRPPSRSGRQLQPAGMRA